ncbi:MAG: flagellar basal body-associated FliL family protein [Hyphomonas sp.]
MKHLITAFVAIACIVAGGVGGHFLRSSGAAPEAASAVHGAEGEGAHAESAELAVAASNDSHGKADKGGRNASALTYYRFSREFIVPLIDNGRVSSLVILNINLEVDAASSQTLFSMEPALRDNIMTTLITLSNDGRTFESISSIENYESLRAMILMNLKKTVPNGINNVLILDMARQDI